RHQRYFHVIAWFISAVLKSGAQRLSASKVLSPICCSRSKCKAACAQRLSASKVLSPTLVGDDMGLGKTCSTPFGIKSTFTRQTSRLAFSLWRCAQRLSASKVLSRLFQPGRTRRIEFVLNAFRHQR